MIRSDVVGQLRTTGHSMLAEAQSIAQQLVDTPSIVHPPGGWRTKRCKHGMRCDATEWLCETCEPNNDPERTAKANLIYSYARLDSRRVP